MKRAGLFIVLTVTLMLVVPLSVSADPIDFNWQNATYDPVQGTWTDGNWVIVDPNGFWGGYYLFYALTPGEFIGWNINDPDFLQQLTYSPNCQMLGVCLVPITFTSCPPDQPLCQTLLPVATPAPGGTPVPVTTPGPVPTPPGGPTTKTTAPEPDIRFCGIKPPYPVVVGQDDDKRGVDVCFWGKVEPVTVTWTENVCTNYDMVCIEADQGVCLRWTEQPICTAWREETRTETCPRPIIPDRVWVTARLNGESVNWIEQELATRYPGARVRLPDWTVAPATGKWTQTVWQDDDKVYYVQGQRAKVQFEDPGVYDLEGHFETQAIQCHGIDFLAVSKNYKTQFKVWLRDQTLIQ